MKTYIINKKIKQRMVHIMKASLENPNVYLLSNNDLIITSLTKNNESPILFNNVKDFCRTKVSIFILDNNGVLYIFKNKVLTLVSENVSKITTCLGRLLFITYNGYLYHRGIKKELYTNVDDIFISNWNKIIVFKNGELRYLNYKDNLVGYIDINYLSIIFHENYINIYYTDKKVIYELGNKKRSGRFTVNSKTTQYQKNLIKHIDINNYTAILLINGICKIFDSNNFIYENVVDIISQNDILYLHFNDGSIIAYKNDIVKLDTSEILYLYDKIQSSK